MSEMKFAETYFALGFLIAQSQLQNQLIEAQREIIMLREQLQSAQPSSPQDEEVFWHIHSGISSEDAAQSSDLGLVQRFYDWNLQLAEKYVRPYVNAKVYVEVVNQMTRGLARRIGNQKAEKALPHMKNRAKVYGNALKYAGNHKKPDNDSEPKQLVLLH